MGTGEPVQKCFIHADVTALDQKGQAPIPCSSRAEATELDPARIDIRGRTFLADGWCSGMHTFPRIVSRVFCSASCSSPQICHDDSDYLQKLLESQRVLFAALLLLL